MREAPDNDPVATMRLEAPAMLGPIHVFGSACFFVFGVIYLAFVHSPYMFFSNSAFGVLSAANWFVVPRRLGNSVRASTFLAIVYLGLVNVAVHLGEQPMPMVFWGMSVAIAAAYLFRLKGALIWIAISLGFYPLTAWLKAGPLADRVIRLDDFQFGLLSFASYAGIMLFLGYSFALFRRRLDRALAELRMHAAALRKSESLLAESQRVARVGSYDLDVQSGTWTASLLLYELFGIDESYPRTLEGWLARVHPDDREDIRRYFQQDVLAARVPFDREYRLVRLEEGREVWVHGRGVLFLDAAGEPVRMVGTIQDITAFKRNEDERRLLETRLFHSQKLESLGVLAGGIAHDFNNLLTGILGNITLARNAAPSCGPELATPLQQAETAAVRAAELTRQMLAFSGKGRFVVQPLDVNAALTEMVELLRSSLPKMVRFRFELAPGLPAILADASQVRQVIMNLVLNAGEAIGEAPGEVTIRSDAREVDAGHLATGFSAGGLAGGRYVRIEVVDTGCGMDDDTKARIFDPFFTTKFTGRGLGLAAVLGIVKGHHGAIWLHSEVGRGSTFTLLFPCAPEGSVPTPAPLRSVAVERAKGRVLVVDDERMVRDLIAQSLQAHGIEVVEAADGAAGLQALQDLGGRADLVLLDLTMPRMGGVEAFLEMRRRWPDLRVVLMSGYTRDNVLTLFTGAAPDDFLEKPFPHRALVATVFRHLRQ